MVSTITNFSELRNTDFSSVSQNTKQIANISQFNATKIYSNDNIKQSNLAGNSAIPANSVTFSALTSETPATEKVGFFDDPILREAVKEGAKVKGTVFGLQYMAAGIALGMGMNSSILNFVPGFAAKAPALFVLTSTFGKAAVTGVVAGAFGASIGAAKGALDGVIVTLAPNKGVAMAAVAVTSALSNLPLLKVSPAFGWTGIGISGAVGAYVGGYLYDESRDPQNQTSSVPATNPPVVASTPSTYPVAA